MKGGRASQPRRAATLFALAALAAAAPGEGVQAYVVLGYPS